MVKSHSKQAPIKRILITPGEPAGIGPDITIQLAQSAFDVELVVIADEGVLRERAALLNLPLKLIACELDQPARLHQPGSLSIIPVDVKTPVKPGQLDPENAPYVIKTLELAAHCCEQKIAKAVVTGPVHKGVINQAGIPFTGHTEFFSNFCHVPQTVMLFVTPVLKVALVTTHLPLAKVPTAITQELLSNVLLILIDGLSHYFSIPSPKIWVCGLNPHAGEGGYLGREEIEIIQPVIQQLQAQKHLIDGPLPADTLFTQQYLSQADAFLAMYHDQVLPLVKYIGFGKAVNVTLGLTFLRTSVDHGTALHLAGKNIADPQSLFAATHLALQLLKKSDS